MVYVIKRKQEQTKELGRAPSPAIQSCEFVTWLDVTYTDDLHDNHSKFSTSKLISPVFERMYYTRPTSIKHKYVVMITMICQNDGHYFWFFSLACQ